MKAILLVSSLLVSSFAAAAIDSSTFLAHEQTMIEQAIRSECGRIGTVTEMSTQVETVNVDNGISDDYFTTQLEVEARMDQNIFDIISVEVKSARYSAYDHTNKVWGAFQVISVDCSANNSGH